jgi:hypothetical protein
VKPDVPQSKNRRSSPSSCHDSSLGDVTFREYVETEWLPNKRAYGTRRNGIARRDAESGLA